MLVGIIITVASVRVVGPKYLSRAASVARLLPCFGKRGAVSEMEEGLYANANALEGHQDNALHLTWGAAGATTEGWGAPEPKASPEPEPEPEPEVA